jgi:hypothetical protein
VGEDGANPNVVIVTDLTDPISGTLPHIALIFAASEPLSENSFSPPQTSQFDMTGAYTRASMANRLVGRRPVCGCEGDFQIQGYQIAKRLQNIHLRPVAIPAFVVMDIRPYQVVINGGMRIVNSVQQPSVRKACRRFRTGH